MSLLDRFKRERRRYGAMEGAVWFRAGYVTALDDVERTGLRPLTDKTKRESADRALGKWVETGSFR